VALLGALKKEHKRMTDPEIHDDDRLERRRREAPPEPREGLEPVEADDTDWEDESAAAEIMGEQSGIGQTYEPLRAVEEGLSYTPPRDPPVIPSENDLQGIEVASGFAPSMEDTDPDVRILPERIQRADLEIQENVGLALRYNSETTHLTDISAEVNEGVVILYGTVPSEDDIARASRIVNGLEGVKEVFSNLVVTAG
jgi:hypothetical protein